MPVRRRDSESFHFWRPCQQPVAAHIGRRTECVDQAKRMRFPKTLAPVTKLRPDPPAREARQGSENTAKFVLSRQALGNHPPGTTSKKSLPAPFFVCLKVLFVPLFFVLSFWLVTGRESQERRGARNSLGPS